LAECQASFRLQAEKPHMQAGEGFPVAGTAEGVSGRLRGP